MYLHQAGTVWSGGRGWRMMGQRTSDLFWDRTTEKLDNSKVIYSIYIRMLPSLRGVMRRGVIHRELLHRRCWRSHTAQGMTCGRWNSVSLASMSTVVLPDECWTWSVEWMNEWMVHTFIKIERFGGSPTPIGCKFGLGTVYRGGTLR